MKQFEKIIWQTHKWEYDDLPELYKKTSQTWQEMNPEWEYKYIPNSQIRDEVAKVSTEYNILSVFDSQPNILSQSDVYREAMVYAYGGLWADMDSICLFPIDKVIEKNPDKEMICSPAFSKFGFNQKTLEGQSLEESISDILSGIECGYWIPNSIFLGKKKNKVSEKIMQILTGKGLAAGSSFMDLRATIYETDYDIMSLELLCGMHDGRFNLRSYS